MHINEIKTSRYLKKEDVTPPKLVTITHLDQQNVALESQAPELKWCLHFKELEKPMVLNPTNAQLTALATGSEETDNWVGKQIVLFNDPSISFQGKLTGGIRVRAPKNTKPAPAPAAAPAEEDDDQVPF